MSLRAHLTTLEASGLIRLAAVQPELEYLFRHALVQDAAYASILKADRRVLHRAVAETLERLYPEQKTELASVLGRHFREAREVDRAREYFILAGDFARQQYANTEALAAYTDALALTSEPTAQIELHLQRGDLLELTGQWLEAEADYRAAVALGEQMTNTEAIMRGQHGLSRLALQRGDYTEARQYLEQSLQLARATGDQRGLATTLHLLGNTHFRQGDHVQSEALFQESLALRRAIGDQHDTGLSLNALGSVAARQGDLAAAQAWYNESLALFRSLGDKQHIGLVIGNMGKIVMRLGDYSSARALYEESLALYQEIGYQAGIADMFGHLGGIAYEQGNYAETQVWYEKSLALHRASGDKSNVASGLGGLGDLAFLREDYQTARTYFTESLTLAQEIGDQPNIAYDLVLLGAVAAKLGQHHKAPRLWAAGVLVRLATNIAWGSAELSLYERVKPESLIALGEDAFNAAWDEGKQMTMAEAIAYALKA